MRALLLLSVALLVATIAIIFSAGQTHAAPPPAAVDIQGVDLHDGMINQVGGTYYLYGTEYACRFMWLQHNTPWCGFGVSTSTSLSGPWTPPVLLFDPSAVDPWTGTTWIVECGSTGAGCFNPRMIQRSGWGANDGVWLLWFNAPADYTRTSANAYYVMGCNGPSGPCGYVAPSGSVHKPSLTICGGNGDIGFAQPVGAAPYLLCTNANQSLSEEQLSFWGADGTGAGATNLAGLAAAESPGAYLDAGTNLWILTYSDPNCGFCSGDGAGYAVSSTPHGPWTAPPNLGFGAPATGRRDLSGSSCGGQGRTVSVLAGQAYEGIDLWTGAANETVAGLHFEPLIFRGNSAPPGTLWQPFAPWQCT